MPTVIPTCPRCEEHMVVRPRKRVRGIKALASFTEIADFWVCPQCDYSEE